MGLSIDPKSRLSSEFVGNVIRSADKFSVSEIFITTLMGNISAPTLNAKQAAGIHYAQCPLLDASCRMQFEMSNYLIDNQRISYITINYFDPRIGEQPRTMQSITYGEGKDRTTVFSTSSPIEKKIANRKLADAEDNIYYRPILGIKGANIEIYDYTLVG